MLVEGSAGGRAAVRVLRQRRELSRFSAVAAKRGLQSALKRDKSICFTAGVAEGTETILFFVAMVLAPRACPIFA